MTNPDAVSRRQGTPAPPSPVGLREALDDEG